MSHLFDCTRCGACCRRVNNSLETMQFDRGDGVCRQYNDDTKQCKIYETRPDICRVDLQYRVNYQDVMSWEEFCKINKAAYDWLQTEENDACS